MEEEARLENKQKEKKRKREKKKKGKRGMNMGKTLLDDLASERKNEPSRRFEEISLSEKKITFLDDSSSHAVIYCDSEFVQLIELDTTVIKISTIRKAYLKRLYEEGKITIIGIERIMTDGGSLPEKIQMDHEKAIKIADEMVRNFSGHFEDLKLNEGKAFIGQQIEKYDVSRTRIWKIYRRFLQSGLDPNALYDGRIRPQKGKPYSYTKKPGRKPESSRFGKILNDDDLKNMDDFIKKYKSRVFSSIPVCYRDMIAERYVRYAGDSRESAVPVVLGENQIPSLNQFRYRLDKKLTAKEKAEIRAKRKDISPGNNTLNNSDSLYDVFGPTSVVEVDEQELDLSSVSSADPSLCIGRFIIHIMIDVQTRLILAFSVSLDNNSIAGAASCFMNLMDDKVELCRKYGIEITEDMWPSGCRIQSARFDCGSEYMSKEMERICNENNITLVRTPPRTGSRKGNVEQQFHIFDQMWKDILDGYGTIQKLHDSRHHEEAVLDYNAVMKICLNCIITHNLSEIENFRRSRDMIEKRIKTSPVSLWNYFNGIYHTARPIGNKDAFMFSLMKPVKCRIDRNGIRWEGLWYESIDPQIDDIRWSGHSEMMDVRIDTRNVSVLYYMKDGQLQKMTLSPRKTFNMDFDGMPLELYMKYRSVQKQLEKQARDQKIEVESVNRLLNRRIFSESKRETYANIENMHVNRIAEKNLIKSENSMETRLESGRSQEKSGRTAEKSMWPSWDEISDRMSDDEKNLID